jgi:hypothetical protein
MRILRAPAVLSAATVAALVLAGCGGSDDPGTAAAASTSAEQETPLTKYLSAVWGGDLSPEEQERKATEDMARQEELAAQCMQEEGFEYAPNTAGMSYGSSSDVEWEPDDREWVAQYGYGAVKSPWNEQPQPTEEFVDPNADYVAALSESEQTAFYEALYGPQPTEEEMAAQEAASEDGSVETEYDWQTAGCQGRAQHEVSGEDLYSSEEFRPLFDAINDLYTETATRPEIVALDGEWAACMDAAGQPGFTTQMDAQQSIYDAQNAFYEDSSLATTELDAEATSGAPFEEPDQAELDALGEEEVALALVDLDCREQTDYRDRQLEVQRQVEEQFIADHQAELDALVAASEQD